MINSGLSTEIEPFSESRLADLASAIWKTTYPAPPAGYRIHLERSDLSAGNEVSLRRHFNFAHYIRTGRDRGKTILPCVLTFPCHDANGEKILTIKAADTIMRQLKKARLDLSQCDYLHINEPWNNRLSPYEAITQIACYRAVCPDNIKVMINSCPIRGWENYNSQAASLYDVHIYDDPETNHLLVCLELAAKTKKTGKIACTEANMYYSNSILGRRKWSPMYYEWGMMSKYRMDKLLTDLRTVLLTAYSFSGDFCYHPAWAGHYGWGLLSPKGLHPILGWARGEWK